MANTVFKLRRSTVSGKVPNTSTLSIGELGVNLTDRILYSSDGTNVFEIGSNNTVLSVTNTLTVATSTTANSSGVWTTSITGNSININTNNATLGSALYVVANGNVGVGAASPTHKFVVDGSTYLNGVVTIGPQASGTAEGAEAVWAAGNSTYSTWRTDVAYNYFRVYTSASETNGNGQFQIWSGNGSYQQGLYVQGNTGIGNNTPQHKLRVEGTASVTSNLTVETAGNLVLSGNAGIYANGILGTAGHTLHSNGTATYWAADDQGVTSVTAGNGLSGGTITTTGTIAVIPGNGLIASNSTGIHVGQGTGVTVNSTTVAVNASYIATISANAATYLNGKTEANLNVNSAIYANSSITNTFTVGTGSYFVSNGNLGVGTSSPGAKLDVYGGSAYVRNIGATTAIEVGAGQTSNQYALIDLIGDTTYTDYGLRIIRGNGGPNSASTLQHRGTGALQFYTIEAGPVSFFTTNTERLRITANGDVGIGTTAPASTLYVGKTLTPTVPYGVMSRGAIANTANSSHVFLYYDTGSNMQSGGATPYTVGTLIHYRAYSFGLGANASITSQFGFQAPQGTEATLNYGFYAGDASAITAGKTNYAFRADNAIATGGGATWNFYAGGTAPNYFNGSSVIGDLMPPLSASGYGWLTLNGSTGGIVSHAIANTEVSRLQSWNAATALINIDARPIIFSTSNSEKVRLAANGNVGIGTSTPTYKLHVIGNSLIDGVLHIGPQASGTAEGAEVVWAAGNSTYSTWRTDIHSNNFRAYTSASETNGNGQFQIFSANGSYQQGLYVQGNVGIGTSSPSTKLELNGGVASIVNFGNQLLFHAGNTVSHPTVIHRNDSSTYYMLLTANNTTPSETWNTLRPFMINLQTGVLTSQSGQAFSGNTTISDTLTYTLLNGQAGNTKDKIRLWNSSAYAIGMTSVITYGGLNDYAMTFQMNNQASRGWWWGQSTHTLAQGAMALTTNGHLTVAHSMRLGYGESDATDPGVTYRLDVSGAGNITGDLDLGGNITLNNFVENNSTFTANAAITSGKNAMSAGPITINSGVTVDIPANSTWTIV